MKSSRDGGKGAGSYYLSSGNISGDNQESDDIDVPTHLHLAKGWMLRDP
jgi:hypothetical protein